MRVIVAGGRDFDDYQLMCARLNHFFSQLDKKKLVIVNGDGPGLWDKIQKRYVTQGADQLAKKYANEHRIPLDMYPPDWDRYGKGAGPRRNEQMAQNADALVAFNTGGRGTANMIKLAEEYGLKIRVIDCQTMPSYNQG
jgi:predicted Rossmann-fold nucleotide-binding protein